MKFYQFLIILTLIPMWVLGLEAGFFGVLIGTKQAGYNNNQSMMFAVGFFFSIAIPSGVLFYNWLKKIN